MKKLLTILISYVIPVLIVGYIVIRLSPGTIVKTLTAISPGWLIVGFSLYLINYFFRSVRFRTLILTRRVSLKVIFQVSCFHSLYNFILPVRTGEFSYVYYLKRLAAVPVTEGVSTLVVARILDLLTAFLFLPVVLLILRRHISHDLTRTIVLFSGAVLLFLTVFFYSMVSGRTALALLDRVMHKLRITKFRLWLKIRSKIEAFQSAFLGIHRKGVYPLAFGLTLLIWIAVYGHFYCIIRALHVDISFWQVILVMMLMIPMTLLPVQGICNLGTHEVGWVFAFRLFGFTQDEALLVAFNSHIILLVYVLLLGGYAVVSTRKKLRMEEHAAFDG